MFSYVKKGLIHNLIIRRNDDLPLKTCDRRVAKENAKREMTDARVSLKKTADRLLMIIVTAIRKRHKLHNGIYPKYYNTLKIIERHMTNSGLVVSLHILT